MWNNRGYVEVAGSGVREFLNRSDAYQVMLKIPFDCLNESNQFIKNALRNAQTYTALEVEFKKITHSGAESKSFLGLYLSSFFDHNDNFKYQLKCLKEEYSAIKANEKTPLLRK